jgi:hypothetical protein
MNKLLLTVSAFTICLTGISKLAAVEKKYSKPVASRTKEKTKAAADPVQYKPPYQQNTKMTAAEKGSKGLGLEISGTTSTNFYAFETKRREENRGKGRGTHLAVDDSRINFEVFGKAPPQCLGGLEYSFLIGISGNAEHEENPIQENRIKLKGEWGTFLAGDTRGVTDFMAVGTFFFVGGTGGFLGDYRAVINETTGIIIRDDLLNRFTPKDQTKVIYVTPRIYGIQAGYSYTPDGSHKGEQHLHSHTPTTSGPRSIVSGVRFAGVQFHEFALNYKNTFANCLDVSLSATGIVGRMRDLRRTLINSNQVNQVNAPFPRRHMKAYALGAVVKCAGFSIGGEFLDNLHSAQMTAIKHSNLGKVYTIGVGYEIECDAVSLSYMYTERKLGHIKTAQKVDNVITPKRFIDFGKTKFDAVAVTGDHELAPGLTAYAEAVIFRMRATQPGNLFNWNVTQNGFGDTTIGPNRGHVIITGARIKF